LLTVGDYSVAGSPSVALNIGVFKLYSLGKSMQVDFTAAGSTGRLSAVAGLSGTESFGTWSDGDTVKLTFKTALPDRFDLKMVAKAFGPNVGKPIRLDCGSFSTTLLLDQRVSEQSLVVENPDRVSSIILTIPAPISPSEVGAGNDRRRLGIGLASIEITPR
jgi:phosphoglycerol transferase